MNEPLKPALESTLVSLGRSLGHLSGTLQVSFGSNEQTSKLGSQEFIPYTTHPKPFPLEKFVGLKVFNDIVTNAPMSRAGFLADMAAAGIALMSACNPIAGALIPKTPEGGSGTVKWAVGPIPLEYIHAVAGPEFDQGLAFGNGGERGNGGRDFFQLFRSNSTHKLAVAMPSPQDPKKVALFDVAIDPNELQNKKISLKTTAVDQDGNQIYGSPVLEFETNKAITQDDLNNAQHPTQDLNITYLDLYDYAGPSRVILHIPVLRNDNQTPPSQADNRVAEALKNIIGLILPVEPALASAPTPTAIITATATATPMPKDTPTPIAIPTYSIEQVGFAGVQKIENKPEWQATAKSAIEQYAKTYNIETSKVKLTIKGFKDKSGNPFALAITSETSNVDADGKLLMIWSQDQKSGEWGWGEATLKKLGEKRGMLMGAFFGGSNTTSTDFDNIAKVVKKEFGLGGVYIGMSSIHPSKDTFNLDYLKWQIKPENNKMSTLLVHPLIWGNDAPNWIRSMDRDKAIEALKGHVQMIMSVLKQQKMDSPPVVVVVNEAYVDQDVLNKIIGPDYVDIAFKTAREAMPEAILIYNDFDNDTPDAPRYKTTQTIINRLISQGLIDGVGIQGRRSKGVDKSQLIIGLKGYGIPVYITEYGFDIRDVPGDDVQRFSFQAKEYQTETEGAIESGVVKAFIDFQLGDRFSAWEDPAFIYSSPKADQTPYNDNLEPKPALYAQRAAFITAKTP